MKKNSMSKRQSEIAGEAFAASVLARAGYDVLVQYGANQPHYDLAAVKGDKKMLVSVKANQDGGWPIALGEQSTGIRASDAVESWFKKQREDVVFVLVQFLHVGITEAPRVYVARGNEIRVHLLAQRAGDGDTILWEDYRRDHPKSRHSDKVPAAWRFSQGRIDTV